MSATTTAAPALLTDEQIVILRRTHDAGPHAPRASDIAFARAIEREVRAALAQQPAAAAQPSADELQRLRAENERLRAAAQQPARSTWPIDPLDLVQVVMPDGTHAMLKPCFAYFDAYAMQELEKEAEDAKEDMREAQAISDQLQEDIKDLRAAQQPAEPDVFERAMKETWGMVDPLHPPGAPGSYARGEHNGILAALKTVRENVDRLRKQSAAGEIPAYHQHGQMPTQQPAARASDDDWRVDAVEAELLGWLDDTNGNEREWARAIVARIDGWAAEGGTAEPVDTGDISPAGKSLGGDPEAPPKRMTDAMRSYIEGMSVSVDVSTGDGDAHHRYFGTVTEVMDDPDDKHGVTLLVQDAKASFKPACPKCGGRTAVDHNNSFRCHRCQQAWPLRPEWTESEGDAK